MKSDNIKTFSILFVMILVILTVFNIYAMLGKPFLPFFQDILPFVQFAIAVFWVIYVIITVQTFKEIHRQTQLQCDAFLLVTSGTTEEIKSEKSINKEESVPIRYHEKWADIVKTNIPQASVADSYLTLTLENKGKSDIVRWTVKMSLSINPGTYLKDERNISGDKISWNINGNASSDIIVEGRSITILVAKYGAYPQGIFSWEIDYSDMRGKDYSFFGGDRTKIQTNALAFKFEKKS